MVEATTAVSEAHASWRVLVVDDSAVIRQAISKMLKAEFEVVVAADGEAGWQEICQDKDVAVLITDIEMPRLDGYALICRVRASDDAHVRELPVIVITGADDDETKARAYACGATDFITKPISSAQLQGCLQAYMRFEQPLADAADGNDPVSDLPGRRAFLARGAEICARDEPLTVLAIALDQARALYREHGDERMDDFVRGVVAAIRAAVPASAYLARLAGAEFGVLLTGTPPEEAPKCAEAVVAAVSRTPIGGVTLTSSVGVASRDQNLRDWDAMFAGVDERLKRAVAQGGNQAATFALSDTLNSAEELVLDDAALPQAEPEPPEPELTAESLPVVGFEEDEKPRKKSGVPSLTGLDRALWLLSQGHDDVVARHMRPLMADLIPLLELVEKRQNLGLDEAIRTLRKAFSRDSSD